MIYVYINSNTALPVGNLLFDNYPGTTGFSLRKLKTSYGGSCIRVRRSSDNAEQEIGFVNDELDVTALLLFCKGTSGFVKTWWDQSGNGAYITNSTAASQPRIVDNGVLDTFKGKPAVYFNNHQLDYTALPFLAHSNNFTAFATSVHTVINGAGAVLNGASGDNKRFALFANNNTNDVSWLIQSDLSGEVFMYQNRKKHKELRTTTAVVTSSKNMSTYDNDITKNTASYAGTYTNDTFRVGKQFLGLTALTGYISEIVLYNSDQSSSYPAIEKDTNRNYLIHYPKDAAVILDLYEVPGYPYTGPLIRVRRSSDNVEADFFEGATPGTLNTTRYGGGTELAAWVGGGNNGFVVTWYDQSGNARNYTQASGIYQPRIVTNGVIETVNGKPAVYSGGGLNRLEGPDISFSQSTIVSTYRLDNHTAPYDVCTIWNRTNSSNFIWNSHLFATTNGNVYLGDANSFSFPSALVAFNSKLKQTIAFGTRDNTKLKVSANNNPEDDDNILAASGLNNTSIFNSYVASSWGYYPLQGHIQNVILWTSDKSADKDIIQEVTNNYYKAYTDELLLDEYGTGCVAAYSLQKLKTGVSDCLLVRRSNDNAEFNIKFNDERLDLEQLADNIGGNAGEVVTWYDQSKADPTYTSYPTGATVVYALREVPGYNYTGALIRVRRGSDNAESDFYQGGRPNTLNSVRGGGGVALETWCGGNSYIARWYDQSGNGNTATQTTAGNQGQITDAGSAILKVDDKIAYRGYTGTFYNLTTSLDQSAPFTFISVYKKDNATDNIVLMASNIGGYTTISDYGNNAMNVDVDNGLWAYSDISRTNKQIWYGFVDTSSADYTKNGISMTPTISGSSKNIDYHLFLGLPDYGNGLNGYFQEMVLWRSNKSADKNTITTAASGYYNETPRIDVTQRTTTKQPQIVASGGSIQTDGSQPALYFNKSNADVLISSTLPSTSKVYSVFAVIKFDNVSAQYSPIVCNGDSTSSGWGIYTEPIAPCNYVAFSGGIGGKNLGVVPSGTHLLTVLRLSDTDLKSFFKLACTYNDTANTMTTPSGSFYVGGGNFSEFFGGHILELIVYDTDKTTDRYSIEQNIKKRYINI